MSHKKNQFWVIQAQHRVFDKLLWLVTYFTETQISQTYQPSHCFKMVHFEAFWHTLPAGTPNKCAVNMKIMTRTL